MIAAHPASARPNRRVLRTHLLRIAFVFVAVIVADAVELPPGVVLDRKLGLVVTDVGLDAFHQFPERHIDRSFRWKRDHPGCEHAILLFLAGSGDEPEN